MTEEPQESLSFCEWWNLTIALAHILVVMAFAFGLVLLVIPGECWRAVRRRTPKDDDIELYLPAQAEVVLNETE